MNNLRDNSDIDFDMPKYPLSRQELMKMIVESSTKDSNEMLVPSNYSLDVKSAT